jgi:ribonuclease-3
LGSEHLESTAALETVLGLKFRDPGLLEQALVHRSFANEKGWPSSASYERMEYLGDAVLELVISGELYRRCPDLTEGELTKGRSTLVCRESLAGVARSLTLGDCVRLGKGEEASGGRLRESIQAATFEAVVAAVYLDRDHAEARRFILNVMGNELERFYCEGILQENPKSSLQEYIQRRGNSPPQYHLVSSEGPDHGPVFTIEVLVDGEVMGVGHGGNKAGAERAAAQAALLRVASQSGGE